MNVGHLRSAIMGDSICRLLEFIGWDVKRVRNYKHEDIRFGMLIAELDDKYPNFNFDQESQEASSFKNTQEEEKTLGNDNV